MLGGCLHAWDGACNFSDSHGLPGSYQVNCGQGAFGASTPDVARRLRFYFFFILGFYEGCFLFFR